MSAGFYLIPPWVKSAAMASGIRVCKVLNALRKLRVPVHHLKRVLPVGWCIFPVSQDIPQNRQPTYFANALDSFVTDCLVFLDGLCEQLLCQQAPCVGSRSIAGPQPG